MGKCRKEGREGYTPGFIGVNSSCQEEFWAVHTIMAGE